MYSILLILFILNIDFIEGYLDMIQQLGLLQNIISESMQSQQPSIPIPSHKTFNLFTSTIIKNSIPSMIQMLKLETHNDLILNNTLHRYVTNILLASDRWLKLYVMFQNNQIHHLFETEVNENIRSVHQVQRTILLEVEHKLICLSYEPGNLRTVGMVSLEFIRLRYGYHSLIRVDHSRKYIFMVAGDYLIFILNQKSKELGMLGECPVFQKALDEVKWCHHEYNYFQTILFTKITKPFFKCIMDVQFDKSHVYFLVQQNEVASIYTLSFESIKPDSTLDTLFCVRFTNLPNPCYKLAVLTPQLNSSFVVFSSSVAYHMALWQQQPISKYQLMENTDNSQLKVRPFNPSHIYYQNNNGVQVLRVLNSGEMESSRVNTIIASDFCMTTVSVNGCLAYLSNGRCIVEIFEGSICIYSWINSITDFYIGKNIIMALEYQDPVYKGGKQSNKVIAIKRNFRCIDKVTSHPKKTFIENLLPAEITSIGNTRYLSVQANNKLSLFKDFETITAQNIENIKEVFEVKTKSELFLGVYYENGTVYLYELEKLVEVWKVEGVPGRVIDANSSLFSVENDGILTVIDFQKRQVSKYQHSLGGDIIKCYLSKEHVGFVKRSFNDKSVDQSTRYLLYTCNASVLEIYSLMPATQFMNLVWSTAKIGSGLASLFNALDKHRSHKEFDEYRSISDSHYVINNLVPSTVEQGSKFSVIDYKYCQLPSQTVLLFLISNNQFYLYKKILAENCVGMLYVRVILPLHEHKISDLGIIQFAPEILKFGSRILYDDVVLEISEPIRQCFMLGGELWIMGTDNKLRLGDIKGNRISGKLVQTVAENNSYHTIDNTPEYYVFFTRDSIELYDKDLNHRSKVPLRSSSPGNISSQQIITAKAFQSMCAVSSCQYFKSSTSTENFQSYKFVFFVYDLKDKQKTDSLVFEEPVVSIKFVRPGRVAFTTSSNFYVYQVKANKLEVVKTVFYSLRSYLGGFSYWRSNSSNSPHFMVFGGAIDGLSFAGFDDEKLIFQQKWFQPLKFGTRDIEIFGFGTSFKAIIADNNKNVVVMDLNNDSASSLYDFHLGTLVNKLTKVEDTGRLSQLVYCCCADGTIRVFTAIKRQQTISLRKFQKLILQQLPTFGGLMLQRKIRQQSRSYKVSCKGNIVQSSIFQLFTNLSQQIRLSIIQKSQYQVQQIQSIISKNCVF